MRTRPNALAPRLRYAFKMLDAPGIEKPQHKKRELLYAVATAIGIENPPVLRFFSDKSTTTLDDFLAENPAFSRAYSIDPYIPWLARALAQLEIGFERKLEKRFQGICIWAAENKIDLNKYTAEQALDASHDYVSKAERKARLQDDPENPIVYRFPDGYHVRELRTPKALHSDGEIVQNCLRHGNYDAAVANGESIIYSLRDEKGLPHVDIEWLTGKVGMGKAPPHTEQVFGKQNRKPASQYVPYLEEFIRNSPVMKGDVLGLLLSGVPANRIDLRGAYLVAADLQGLHLPGGDLTGADLGGADLGGCNLGGATLLKTNLEGASLEKAYLRGADLSGANLKCAWLWDADLREANLEGANLWNATLSDAVLIGAHLEGANLADVEWDGTLWPKGFTPPPPRPRRA